MDREQKPVSDDEDLLAGLHLDLELAGELGRRVGQQQALRSAAMRDLPRDVKQALYRRLAEVDEDNSEWLRELLRRRGWPGHSIVGESGSQAAWLLAQHADADPAFQAECLKLLTVAVEAGEAEPSSLAYLDDRVRLARGEPQRYGTQCEQGEDGRYRPRSLAEPDAVDRLRAEVGLGPLADYVAQMTEMSQIGPT